MKVFLSFIAAIYLAFPALAHGPHPIINDFNKSIEEAYDSALHKVGYSESDFDDLSGMTIQQDSVRKIRIARFHFAAPQCAKNIELYFKLDGTSYLAHKVVGCPQ